MNGHHSAATKVKISRGRLRYWAQLREGRAQLARQRYNDFIALKRFPANRRVQYESSRRAAWPADVAHWEAYYRGWRLVERWTRSGKDFALSEGQLEDIRHLFPGRMKQGRASLAGRSFTTLALNPFRGDRVPSQRSRLQLHRPVAVPPAQHSLERPSGA